MDPLILTDEQLSEALADYVRKHYARRLLTYRVIKKLESFKGLAVERNEVEVRSLTL